MTILLLSLVFAEAGGDGGAGDLGGGVPSLPVCCGVFGYSKSVCECVTVTRPGALFPH